MNLKGLIGLFARWQLHRIRTWDVRSNNSVDQFISNSAFVARRISKFYGRSSKVLFPPVDTSLFTPETHKQDYYVAAGRFAPFKRLDLVAEAFAGMPNRKLVMIGDGPEMGKIRSKAAKNVEFVGFQSAKVVRHYLANAKALIFPSEEDFGILPVEAQACGTPVLAYGRGGALETVKATSSGASPTGMFFYEQSAQAICDVVNQFEASIDEFDAEKISQHAQNFSIPSFKLALNKVINEALRDFSPSKATVPVN